MKRIFSQFHGRLAVIVSSSTVIASLCLLSAPVSARTSQESIKAGIRLSVNHIPRAKTMEVFKLRNQAPPTKFMDQVAMTMNPDSKGLEPLSRLPLFEQYRIKVRSSLWGSEVGNGLGMYEDTRSGDAQVFPQLSDQGGVSADQIDTFLEKAGVEARRMTQAYNLIAKDGTTVAFQTPQPLDVNTASPNGDTSKPSAVLAYVPVTRSVGNYPVFGLGSRALLAFDPQMNVQAFVRAWKLASPFASVHETRSSKQIRQAILNEFRGTRAMSANVNDIQIAYYDGNMGYMQPVYRFTATVFYKGQNIAAPDVMVGYLGIGKQYEGLPSLLARHGHMPGNDTERSKVAPRFASPSGAAGDPCVGRYVVRNDDPGWVNNANLFWLGISSGWGSSFFHNCQYYWGEPWQYESLKDQRANLMNITLTEGHGDWWDFTTNKNCCDAVNINGDIPSPGFGGSANGNLDFWIIHSCEVVPSPDDTSSWANPWWTIFGGLHAVLGYRTIMYINDSVGSQFGTSLRFFVPVISAWLNAVMSAPDYASHPVWQGPGGAHGIGKLMGRPSAITMTGHQNDIADDTSNPGRASSLTIFWFPG